jgi:hypothetical protein
MGLLALKNGWNRVRAFLAETVLMVLPQDFLHSSGNGDHNVGCPFLQFGNFFAFNSFDATICLNE